MKAALAGAVAVLAFLMFTVLLTGPEDAGPSQAWETARFAIDSPQAVVMERDARLYALETAKVKSAEDVAMAQERTLRFMAVVVGAIVLALSVVAGVVAAKQPQRVVIIHQLPNGFQESMEVHANAAPQLVRRLIEASNK